MLLFGDGSPNLALLLGLPCCPAACDHGSVRTSGPARSLLPALVLAICLCAPATAGAQSRTLGSPLTQDPNTFGCETKPTFTEQSSQGDYFFLSSGQPDCTWYQAGVVGSVDYSDPRTGSVPANGRITNVAVRSGPNPAVMRFVIVRQLAQPGQGSACCFFVSETPAVQPQPNGITNFTVNIPVERNVNPDSGVATADYIGVSAVSGTGLLPLHSNGRHNTLRDYTNGQAVAGFFYPRLGSQPNDSGGGRREEGIPGMEVLLRWTWTPPGSAPPPNPDSGGSNQGGSNQGGSNSGTSSPPEGGVAPVSIQGSRLSARNGRVSLGVRCMMAADCRGRVLLRTRSSGGRVVGSSRVGIGGGRTAAVRVSLNRLGRSLARRGSVRLVAVLDLGAQGTVSKNLTLRRAR